MENDTLKEVVLKESIKDEVQNNIVLFLKKKERDAKELNEIEGLMIPAFVLKYIKYSLEVLREDKLFQDMPKELVFNSVMNTIDSYIYMYIDRAERDNSVEKYFDKLKQQVEIRMSNIMYDNYGNETPEHEQFIHILNGLLKELKKGGDNKYE